ncbi:MAG TPA: FAD-dependent oxidoreductase [Bryobacteraceae bacterium]|nr:FAD-dependent oxidoreductase [Bryobacteraceae bacterium]
MAFGIVIAGGGQAGFQTAASLRAEGYEGPITLLGDEPHFPYQRPPLSKAFILGKQNQSHVILRPESYYRDRKIDFLPGEKAVSLETPERRLHLGSGASIRYDSLVLATGARNRKLPVPGADLDGVCYLRTLDEAIEIKQRLEQAERVAVIGGGFIGLEIAASARTLGKEVTAVEALPRLMARVVAPVVSEFFRAAHAGRGVDILLSAQVEKIQADGKIRQIVLKDGRTVPADLVVVGVGIEPNTELAAAAGFNAPNGISVNEFLHTEDRNIYAIGDCAEYPNPFAGSRVRLESVQNAVDQAVCVARAITGKRAPYNAAPWFWSDQFDLRLQMAGLPLGHGEIAIRGNPESGKFSVFYFRDGRLCAVDSINRPADHLAARKLITGAAVITPEQASDESVNLKSLAAGKHRSTPI